MLFRATGIYLLILPATLHAQRLSPRVFSTVDVERRHATLTMATARGAAPVLVRGLSGIVGASLGAVVGGFIGYGLVPHGECGDDPGLCETIAGALVGSFAGLSIGAAMPRFASSCSFRSRFIRSLGGSSVGGVLGYAVGGARRDWLAAATPLGAIAGAAVGAHWCRAAA